MRQHTSLAFMRALILNFVSVFVLLNTGCTTTYTSTLGNSSQRGTLITVTGSGSTKEAAFKDAVRNAAGVIISSQVETQGDKLIKDEILDYSSGYIESYEIVKESAGYIEIKARVSSDKVANRILGTGLTHKNVAEQSSQLYGQAASVINARESGDAMLTNLIAEYPNKAIAVTIGELKTQIDRSGKFSLHIPTVIKWSKGYLDSLEQTIRYLSIDKCFSCDSTVKFSKGIFDINKLTGYRLADDQQYQIIKKNFSPMMLMKFTYIAKNGEKVSACYPVDLSTTSQVPLNQLVSLNYYDKSINLSEFTKSYTVIQPVNYKKLEELKQIDAEMVMKC